MNEQYLTVSDVAACLKVSRMTVYNFINTGKLETIKIGKSRRIAVSALQRFIHQYDKAAAAGVHPATT